MPHAARSPAVRNSTGREARSTPIGRSENLHQFPQLLGSEYRSWRLSDIREPYPLVLVRSEESAAEPRNFRQGFTMPAVTTSATDDGQAIAEGFANLLPIFPGGIAGTERHSPDSRVSISPAQSTRHGTGWDGPDPSAHPLKVAARVRIPYGLPRNTCSEPLFGVALCVSLRHFVATQLFGAGVDARTIAGRLGHRDAATTLNVYAHFLQSVDRGAADIIGSVIEFPTGEAS